MLTWRIMDGILDAIARRFDVLERDHAVSMLA
jgi:hypothetical protein